MKDLIRAANQAWFGYPADNNNSAPLTEDNPLRLTDTRPRRILYSTTRIVRTNNNHPWFGAVSPVVEEVQSDLIGTGGATVLSRDSGSGDLYAQLYATSTSDLGRIFMGTVEISRLGAGSGVPGFDFSVSFGTVARASSVVAYAAAELNTRLIAASLSGTKDSTVRLHFFITEELPGSAGNHRLRSYAIPGASGDTDVSVLRLRVTGLGDEMGGRVFPYFPDHEWNKNLFAVAQGG